MIPKLVARFSINQMLVISHLLLVVILVAGFSYARYQSEWHRHIDYSASIAKLTLAPHIPFISSSVAGINYANLTTPSTKQMLASLDDLEFLEIAGQSDYSNQEVQIRYFKRFDYLWRADVKQEEIAEHEKKLNTLTAQIEANGTKNLTKYRKLVFIENKVKREHAALLESLYVSNNVFIPWSKPEVTTDSYYLDEELCTLNVVLPLTNKNGGEIWAVFDASELTQLQRSLLEEIIAEAIVALAISLILIGWVSHWIVSPLKSLAEHMRLGQANSDLNHLTELERSDEIGQLARAYQGLLIKLDNQLNILRTKSDTDPLTGLGSRHKYSRTAVPFLKRHLAKGHYVGLIVCDVDNFKAFNDIYGHTEGDNALSRVGSKIKQLARDSDLAFRYGGEEFVIFCARPDLSQLANFTERLRHEIAGLDLVHEGNQPFGIVTASVGGAVAQQRDLYERFNTHQELQEAMFNMADKALYECKQSGRNKVIWASSSE
ncbi:sensor domain-containing diguanylate cyclase [Vibrio sp. VPAP30]|uniref:sensor domain-containing diguanylate cyclase n=1 Tax=Vibrio sp. VPAP30 TaxID=1647102 RepID=UPI0006579B3D|nr:sensor domain-containing diguanylate cyclase [Vibrio sp. VPAP30]KLN63282.1 diguanylate cyclase [Vibrio sp. VPAP30]